MTTADIKKTLAKMGDASLKEFSAKLIPTADPKSVLGIKIPEIRRLAKTLSAEERSRFIAETPHEFYEENLLHAAILCGISDFDEAIEKTDRFLPYIDNWAVCDALNPKGFSKDRKRLLANAYRWANSERVYTARFGLGTLMRHYLGEDFFPQLLYDAAAIRGEDYYFKTMQAWFFAEALAKRYDEAVKILLEKRLEPWVHNKAIQKARESFRIDAEKKEYLKTLKL